MTVQYAVRLVSGDADVQGQRAILATLPNRFRVVEHGPADVLVASGGAAATAALRDITPDTRGIFVSAPGKLSAPAFKEIRLHASHRPIGLALEVAPSLTDQALAALRMEGLDTAVIVDCASEVSAVEPSALRGALFEQLMLLQAVAGRISELGVLARTEMQWVFAAQIESAWKAARLSVRRSFRDIVTLNTVSSSVRRRARFISNPHAEPARIEIFDRTGCRSPSPSYQGGYRSSWQKFHEVLSGASAAVGDLDAAEHVLRLMP